MKGRVLFGIVVSTLLVTMLFSGVGNAGDKNNGSPIKMGESDTIFGYCFSSPQSDDASVEAYITTRPLEINTDIVGVNGQVGVADMYMYDAGNYKTNWTTNDVTRNVFTKRIGKVGFATSVDLTLISGSGCQQMLPLFRW